MRSVIAQRASAHTAGDREFLLRRKHETVAAMQAEIGQAEQVPDRRRDRRPAIERIEELVGQREHTDRDRRIGAECAERTDERPRDGGIERAQPQKGNALQDGRTPFPRTRSC